MTIPLLKKQQKSWDWKIPTNKKIISEQIWQWKSIAANKHTYADFLSDAYGNRRNICLQ